ncbi:phage tail tape measure protein [Clostridium akagii]|uniref:phage tail tape measure protein n=1 Tax=Clostridium akagii TaxID=91623 RepID=UPI000690C721|nr:phage tail tape measure protein [Clostridium akagii]
MADEIAGLAVKIAMDDSSFTTGIQDLKRQLTVLDTGFKSSITSSDTFGKSLDGLKLKASSLGEQITVQKQVVQQYQEQLQKSKTALEQESTTMMELKTKVDASKTAWEESKITMGENTEASIDLEKQYKALDAEYTKQEASVIKNFKAVDGYTIQTNKQQASLNSMQNSLASTNKEIATQGSNWITAGTQLTTLSTKTKAVGESLTTVGESLTTKVTLPIVAGLGLATKSASDFEHQLADIRKEVAATGIPVSQVNSLMSQMSSSSLTWSEDFGQSTDDINQGLLTLVKDGYTASEAMDTMQTSLYTARGSNEELETTVDKLGSSLEAYGMKTNDAATTTANMTHMADTFAYTANHTKASISSLGEAFSIVGPLASQLKIPMSQTAAAIGELESNGIDASTAATSLQAGLVNLTKPTKKMQTQLDLMKFSAFDSNGKMKDLTTTISEMSQKTSGWTDKQREAAYATIFGKESLASWGILMHKGSGYLSTLSTNANNATGEVKRLSDSMKDTAQNNFKELQESVSALGIAFGQDVLPSLVPVVKQVTSLVQGFSKLDDSTKKNIVTVLEVVAVAGPTLLIIGKVATGLSVVEKGVGRLTGFIGKKIIASQADAIATEASTVATETTTTATEANTVVEEVNTAAEEANTVAKGTGAVATEATTAATVAKTAVTEASTLAEGGAATAAATTATEIAGVGVASATAGEAVAGAGAAAVGAGEALGGTALAGGVAATGLAALAISAAPWLIAGAAIVGTGIAIHHAITEQAAPSVDLFNDKIQEHTKTMGAYGTEMDVTTTKTVNFDDATKTAVSSYMQMDDNVKKTMTDIYVNSDKFTGQTKTAVISQFTDMANKVTNLNGNAKDKVLTDFTNMVGNTSTLSTKNKNDIVAQYTQMVSKVSGLTAQQKTDTIKKFTDTMTQSTGITKTQVDSVVSQFSAMGTKIKNADDTQYNTRFKTMQDYFAKSDALSTTDEQKVLANMTSNNNAQKAKIDTYEAQITAIYTNASNQHRQLTTAEQTQVNDIQNKMNTTAVTSLSSNEIQSKVILERMKSYGTSITEQQATSIIQSANKQRDGSVAAANDQYNKTVANFIYQRDVTHSITADQATKLIADAGKIRDQSIQSAKDQREQVVGHLTKMNSDLVKDMDTSTGKMLSPFTKFGDSVGQEFAKISQGWANLSFPEKTLKVVGNIVSGLTGLSIPGLATGTTNATKGLTLVGEKGPELVYMGGGETVLNNNDTTKLMQNGISNNLSSMANSMSNMQVPSLSSLNTSNNTTNNYVNNVSNNADGANSNNSGSSKIGDLIFNVEKVIGYPDLKKLMRDANNIKTNINMGKGAV